MDPSSNSAQNSNSKITGGPYGLAAVRTEKAPAAIGPYSQAIYEPTTGLLFCSGQLGIDPATGALVEGGASAEARQIFRNVGEILASAGSSLAEVVRTVLFLTDLNEFSAVNAVYADVFREPYPARSTLQVSGLPKGANVEIEITAILSKRLQDLLSH